MAKVSSMHSGHAKLLCIVSVLTYTLHITYPVYYLIYMLSLKVTSMPSGHANLL